VAGWKQTNERRVGIAQRRMGLVVPLEAEQAAAEVETVARRMPVVGTERALRPRQAVA
jgi:hypothetical protein